MLDTIFFYFFTLLVLGGGILTITRRNPVHSALWLIVALLGVSGLYLLQKAEFLFAVQIMVYVGGITVLFLFVIMLVNLDQSATERRFSRGWLLGLTCSALVAVEVLYFLSQGAASFRLAAPEDVSKAGPGNVEVLADTLFSRYLLPFEIASLLLLVAVVGSVVMAKKRL